MQKKELTIYVTRPNLPPLEKLHPYLEQIWQNKILTNNGPFHQQFEKELAKYFNVEHINLFANATLALVVGLQALRITGEVITTPFSFVATTHALKWNGITPVFCDIEEKTMNIDPTKIEALITPKTTAIMPVHVYGHPCDTEAIQDIADKYGLKVIYDAAHAFGIKMKNKNLLLEGDMSVLSFHGTKLFTTFEGGAIISKDEKLKKRIDYLKNFGFADELTVIAPGINGKMNEFQSVIGLLSLEIVEEEIANRKKAAETYFEKLKDIKGIKVFNNFDGYDYNYAYLPVLIDENEFGASREKLYDELKKHNIYARRYFYPLISNMPTYRSLPSAGKENLPVANKIGEQVLCLPIYGALEVETISKVIGIIENINTKK
ncbi:MAG: DegT/DnrJ/EryC1/StrS family aminotransferase [Ignavibacteriaceae bacterium]|nr:DegT/DnrJ/EryC1/StrS family aminotransferase [Ignavibacteriaceae bacterium]